MSSQQNLEDIYSDLNRLLEDVCRFLTKAVQNGALSSAAQFEAQTLVTRSKQQVDVITSIQDNASSSYPYLQMQKPNALDEYVDADHLTPFEEDIYEESYDQVDPTRIETLSTQITNTEDYCPYSDLPANQLSEKAVKFGALYRKERYFILEQKKQLLAGLIGYWLIIYSGKKDVKPLQVLNLTDYRAHNVEQKKDPTFEVYSENKKSFEFIARSDKDMEQWIVAINHKKQKSISNRDLPDIPTNVNVSHTPDTFDNIDPSSMVRNKSLLFPSVSDSGSENDIYENLEDIHNENSNNSLAKTPNLPPRQPVHHYLSNNNDNKNETYNNIQLPSTTDMEDTEENTYDPVQDPLFEEDEEIYDEPQMRSTDHENNYEDENCSYDIPKTESNELSQITAKTEKPPEPPEMSADYEDEEAEYDEMSICTNNVTKLNDTLEQKKTEKPAVTSPKPKLISKIDKMPSFTKQQTGRNTQNIENSSDNTSSRDSSNRIHNLIQQMEANLVLKGGTKY